GSLNTVAGTFSNLGTLAFSGNSAGITLNGVGTNLGVVTPLAGGYMATLGIDMSTSMVMFSVGVGMISTGGNVLTTNGIVNSMLGGNIMIGGGGTLFCKNDLRAGAGTFTNNGTLQFGA